MKRLKILAVGAVGLLTAVTLMSCYWMGNIGKGNITMELSGVQAKQEGEVVRVYLLADGKLFSTGGGVPFSAEVPLQPYPNDTRISIQGLPVGPVYQALVGIGAASGGIFYTNWYGNSSSFTLTPNKDTSVTVTTLFIPYSVSFAWELSGKNLKGVAAASSGVYAAEASKIYWAYYDYGQIYIDLQDNTYDMAANPVLSSYRVNSLSSSYNSSFSSTDAFLNTNNGIIPFELSEGWYFDTSFTFDMTGPKNILKSGYFLDPAPYNYAYFFIRTGGLGGWYPNAEGPWVNLDRDGLLDMALGATYAYFAAEDGAFALPTAFLTDETPTLAEHQVRFSGPAKILSLGFYPIIGANPGGRLFMGTPNGVWEATVDETSAGSLIASVADPETTRIIPETAGQRIERIEISPYHPYDNQAFLSPYWLYIRYQGSVYEIPFFAVIPGRATGMAWDYDGNLYISGTEGLSAISVGYLGC